MHIISDIIIFTMYFKHRQMKNQTKQVQEKTKEKESKFAQIKKAIQDYKLGIILF